jgi:hypothetical protein
MEKIAELVERLRELDDQHKRLVILWGGAGVTLVIIILWFGYFMLSFRSVATGADEEASLWDTVRGGTVTAATATARGARIVYGRLAGLLGTEKTIEIEDDRQF